MTNPPDSIPLLRAPEETPGTLAAAFRGALANLAASLRKWLLPHFAVGMGLFLFISYITSYTLFAGWHTPWKWAGMLLVILIYAALAFGYAFFTTALLAVRLACVHWGEFIEAVLDHVQTYAAEKTAQLPVGISKPQAKTILRAGIRETLGSFQPAQTGLARAVALLLAGVTAIAVRAVLLSKVSKWSGRTIQLGKLFAGKATLAGAVFLNLRFFTTFLLALCYAAGATLLLLNFVILLQYIVK